MRGLMLLVAGAIALTPSSIAAADDDALLEPIVAKQCAVWASYAGAITEDEQEVRALSFATNYFIGYYEGKTGQGIGDSLDADALVQVAGDLEGFTEICAAHIEHLGERMGEWGEQLTALGTSQ